MTNLERYDCGGDEFAAAVSAVIAATDALQRYSQLFRDASCIKPDIDPTIFYPGQRNSGRYTLREARAVCAECPVVTKRTCLTIALTAFKSSRRDDYGVWAGTTPKQRDDIRLLLSTGYDIDVVIDMYVVARIKKPSEKDDIT